MTQDNSIDNVEVKKGYYKSGALWWEVPYVNGEKHGIRKWYYESGALKVETPYVNGEKHGIVKWYYESGALEGETPYVNGKVHGIVKSYDKEKSNIYQLTLCNKDLIFVSLRREGYKASSITS